MDAPKYNRDKRPPWTKEKPGEGVFPPCFDEKIHIFWGPGQLTDPDKLYVPPDPNAWKPNQLLMIPQVTRFIYATQISYDSDGYPKEKPDPGPTTVTWRIIKVTDHEAPFPNDCMIYMRLYRGENAGPETSTYSVRKYARDYITGALKEVFGKFQVGMKFEATPPIDYNYQNPDGFPADGFYTRVGGRPVVPT